MDNVDVWIIHSERKILISESGGVPVSVCSYMSPEAKIAAETRGYPTVTKIVFPNDYLLSYRGENAWFKAYHAAHRKAKELGYSVERE